MRKVASTHTLFFFSRKRLEVDQVIQLNKLMTSKEVPTEAKDKRAMVLVDGPTGYLFEYEKQPGAPASADLSRQLPNAIAACTHRRVSISASSPRVIS